MLDKCKETVKGAHKYVNDKKAENFLRQNKLCPPPKGHWTMTFSKIFAIQDLPKSFFGPLQSVGKLNQKFIIYTVMINCRHIQNEYWLTFNFTDGKIICKNVC